MDIAERLESDARKMEERQAVTKSHKLSSRVFFDTLEAMYPPQNTEDYWDTLLETVRTGYVSAGKPPLLKHLMVALIDYMEEVIKTEEKRDDDQ